MNSIWPTLAMHEVYHVGGMDASQKYATHNQISQEGNGLSVSLDPLAWRKIAKLGGQPVWILSTAAPAKFLDARALTPQAWQEILQWAQSQGLVQMAMKFKVSWYDSEMDKHFFSTYGDMPAAQAEFDGYLADGMEPAMMPVDVWVATPAMCDRIGFSVPDGFVENLALTLFAEDVLFESQDVHGVWWADQLDVSNYLAPRGVIHLRALRVWGHEQVHATEQNRNRP